MNQNSLREQEVKKALEKIQEMKNMVERPMYNINEEEQINVEIKVDNKVEHGKFIPSKVIPNLWYASEQTYRAMKKDIFTLGNSVDELVDEYICHSCQKQLDKQFWRFCPYCGERFLE